MKISGVHVIALSGSSLHSIPLFWCLKILKPSSKKYFLKDTWPLLNGLPHILCLDPLSWLIQTPFSASSGGQLGHSPAGKELIPNDLFSFRWVGAINQPCVYLQMGSFNPPYILHFQWQWNSENPRTRRTLLIENPTIGSEMSGF